MAAGRRGRARWRGAGLTTLGVAVLAAAVVGGEVWLAMNREYLPTEPAYRIDARVVPRAADGPGEAEDGTGPGGTVELVVLGDSTAAGVGSPSVEETLPALLAQRVADAVEREVHVVGYGVSGARTDDVRSEQVPRLLDAGVDVVVIVIGSNDVTHVTPAWEMEERTRALLAAARARTGAPVVLGGIPQFRTVPALLQPLRAITGAYAGPLRRAQHQAVRAEGDGVRFVDIAAEASPRFVGVPESMSSDGFHPSEVGYGFWADALAPVVAQVVDEA